MVFTVTYVSPFVAVDFEQVLADEAG